jgi:hypothetical protein
VKVPIQTFEYFGCHIVGGANLAHAAFVLLARFQLDCDAKVAELQRLMILAEHHIPGLHLHK